MQLPRPISAMVTFQIDKQSKEETKRLYLICYKITS